MDFLSLPVTSICLISTGKGGAYPSEVRANRIGAGGEKKIWLILERLVSNT